MPQAIIVEPNKYEGPRFEATKLIPILPIIQRFEYKKVNYTRKNFPLVPYYAIIVYKSQCLILKKVVLNFIYKDYAPSLLYITVSRVKNVYNIIIKEPFNKSRF